MCASSVIKWSLVLVLLRNWIVEFRQLRRRAVMPFITRITCSCGYGKLVSLRCPCYLLFGKLWVGWSSVLGNWIVVEGSFGSNDVERS